ncbi:MAG: hypothetical protein ACXABI_09940 [Candidatus Hodarchaeales archaeon]|jgi:hypothetical protein
MVKLFGKKDKKTANFKFDASIKLKDLPHEEYSHVTFALQVAILRFERMLKESLLEGYISSTTLEKVSRGFKIASVRDLDIPESESVRALFGSESPLSLSTKPESMQIKEPQPSVAPKEEITPPSIPAPATPVVPEPVMETPSIPIAEPEEKPKISFSFPPPAPELSPAPESPPAPASTPSVSTPEPIAPISKPSIPKISFPTEPTPSISPPTNPLENIRGRREEDRATGIAILRKQMLTELKKIRSVVAEQDQ